MSAFDEIKGLFTTELTNCPQYLVATKIKNLIIQDILAPNIDIIFTYKIEDAEYIDINNKEKENRIIILCLKCILGITVDISYNDNIVAIDMQKFLN